MKPVKRVSCAAEKKKGESYINNSTPNSGTERGCIVRNLHPVHKRKRDSYKSDDKIFREVNRVEKSCETPHDYYETCIRETVVSRKPFNLNDFQGAKIVCKEELDILKHQSNFVQAFTKDTLEMYCKRPEEAGKVYARLHPAHPLFKTANLIMDRDSAINVYENFQIEDEIQAKVFREEVFSHRRVLNHHMADLVQSQFELACSMSKFNETQRYATRLFQVLRVAKTKEEDICISLPIENISLTQLDAWGSNFKIRAIVRLMHDPQYKFNPSMDTTALLSIPSQFVKKEQLTVAANEIGSTSAVSLTNSTQDSPQVKRFKLRQELSETLNLAIPLSSDSHLSGPVLSSVSSPSSWSLLAASSFTGSRARLNRLPTATASVSTAPPSPPPSTAAVVQNVDGFFWIHMALFFVSKM